MASSLKITLVFLVFGLAWIYLTDLFFLPLSGNNLELYYEIQTYKGFIFVLLSASLIFLVSYLLNQKLVNANRHLKISNKKLSLLLKERLESQKQVAEANIKGQEEERRKLAGELHDNVNQILATTKLYLDLARDNASMQPDMLAKSSENVSLVISELRSLSKSLSPPGLKDIGLIASVDDLLNSILPAVKLEVFFYHDQFSEEDIVDEKKLMVYRIIQEQMNNILKHAGAEHVIIELKSIENHLDLSIEDDGKGFDPSKQVRGIGLKNISNRAQLYNGSMHVDTAPGSGCVLHVRIEI